MKDLNCFGDKRDMDESVAVISQVRFLSGYIVPPKFPHAV